MGTTLTVYLWTFLLSMTPISEIRGSMIYALNSVDHSVWNILTVYFISVAGNFLPVPFIMLIFRPIVKWLKKTRVFGKFAHWLEERTKRKAGKLSKASAGALLIFVAIPFPTTGAMIASLLDMRFKYALPAILAGIMISGVVMTLLVTGVLNLGALGELMTS